MCACVDVPHLAIIVRCDQHANLTRRTRCQLRGKAYARPGDRHLAPGDRHLAPGGVLGGRWQVSGVSAIDLLASRLHACMCACMHVRTHT